MDVGFLLLDWVSGHDVMLMLSLAPVGFPSIIFRFFRVFLGSLEGMDMLDVDGSCCGE